MVEASPRKCLNDEEVLAVYHFLLENTTNGKLRHGVVQEAAEKFEVCRKTILRIRARAKSADDPGKVVASLKKRREGRVGRKRYPVQVLHDKVRAVPLRMRGTFASLSVATGICHSTLHRACNVQRRI